MSVPLTIPRLVEAHAARAPDRVALCAPGRADLTAGALRAQVTRLAGGLRAAGVGRADRVAVVLPNGPELAVTFLATAAAAVSAPLNPGYREEEFEFYFGDLGAAALVVQAGATSPAVAVAERLGVPVLRIAHDDAAPAGTVWLEGGADSGPLLEPASPDDIALVLHTSGTTSRPKAVPLTHGNLCASAAHIGRTLALSADDRCLNVMPLFHVHGLVAALLASLGAGGSVACTPGFLAPEFLGWMAELRPTWYTAVPTMHQAILARATRSHVPRGTLRFVRSSSAALPPSVMADLESVFGVPVIEAFGMTEAAHQMASNPLPPGARKPGSVGRPAGPEITVLDELGAPAPQGVTGEVAIRGPNVTAGYLNNPDANRQAFTGGWFRTGDQGYLDADGYLFLTGRLKELINRGGEKIAPREVEEVLLDHPAVAEAAVFAVPHPRLGEEVGAIVVPRSGWNPSERQLREHAASRLADFKIPSLLLLRQEIPKGPTGKVQRVGLAERLGITAARDAPAGPSGTAPRTPLEHRLAGIWSEVLRMDLGVHDHFLDLGGDSMLAARLVSRIQEELRLELPQRSLFDAPTVADQATVIAAMTGEPDAP